MTPYECYVAYTALKAHFNTINYDYNKYNGKIKSATPANYEKSGLKIFFLKLAKHRDPLGFLISNFLKNPKLWIRNIVYDENAENNYIEYSKIQESLTYTFINDLKKLNKDFNSNFLVSNNDHPKILKLYLSSEIKTETLVILINLLHLDKYWIRYMPNDIILKDILFKINKYKSLFKYDEYKLRKILLDTFHIK